MRATFPDISFENAELSLPWGEGTRPNGPPVPVGVWRNRALRGASGKTLTSLSWLADPAIALENCERSVRGEGVDSATWIRSTDCVVTVDLSVSTNVAESDSNK